MQYQQYGGPEVLRSVEIPDPKMFQDLVLVRIEAAALNPADIAFQLGYADSSVDSFFPVTPGWDLAGVVEQIGDATSEFAPGDEVIGYVRDNVMHYGAYAEMIAARPQQLIRKPSTVSWAEAAGLPVAGLTAYQAIVHTLSIREDDVVLIHGAAGGVGHLAVQIALVQGATVIGTGSPSSQDFIASLGATPVIYGDSLIEQVRRIAPDGVTAVLDSAGRGSLLTTEAVSAPGVRVATIVRSREYSGVLDVFLRESAEDFSNLVDLAASRQVVVKVAQTFPLDQAAEAQRRLAAGHVHGKLVLLNAATS